MDYLNKSIVYLNILILASMLLIELSGIEANSKYYCYLLKLLLSGVVLFSLTTPFAISDWSAYLQMDQAAVKRDWLGYDGLFCNIQFLLNNYFNEYQYSLAIKIFFLWGFLVLSNNLELRKTARYKFIILCISSSSFVYMSTWYIRQGIGFILATLGFVLFIKIAITKKYKDKNILKVLTLNVLAILMHGISYLNTIVLIIEFLIFSLLKIRTQKIAILFIYPIYIILLSYLLLSYNKELNSLLPGDIANFNHQYVFSYSLNILMILLVIFFVEYIGFSKMKEFNSLLIDRINLTIFTLYSVNFLLIFPFQFTMPYLLRFLNFKDINLIIMVFALLAIINDSFVNRKKSIVMLLIFYLIVTNLFLL